MIYSLTNPVKDHLVAHATDWPGFTSLVAQLHDKTLTVERPHWFFRPDGPMPEKVSLRFRRPPCFAQLTQQKWTDMIRAAVAVEERNAAAARKGARVLGRKAVLRQSAFARPETHEPRRELSPRVAARSKWRRIECLRRNAEFLEHYRAAFDRRRAGSTRVLFPHGTYKLLRLGLVRCKPPPV